MKSCPQCGASNPVASEWCGQCYTRLAVPPPPPPPPPPPATETSSVLAAINARAMPSGAIGGAFQTTGSSISWTCSTCGNTNPMTSDRCVCGTSFTNSLRGTRTAPGPAIGALAARPARGFFERITRGFRLIGVSWKVLRLDPELMLFPIIGAILIVAFTGLVFGWIHGVAFGDWFREGTLDNIAKWELWIYYAISFTISVYFQAAVVACAMLRFDGGDPRLSDGFAAAGRKFVQLTGWALIAATVALLLRWLEEAVSKKLGRAGRVAVRVIDIAWKVATYFAVPVILFEDVSSAGAVGRSGRLFKKTWAETFAGALGMGTAFSIIYFVIILVTVAAAVAISPVMIVLGVLALIATVVVECTLSGILNAALYRYATTGQPPVPFSYSDVGGVWTPPPLISR